MPRNSNEPHTIEFAAGLASLLTLVGLALFIAELGARYGLADALVSSVDVRVALANGTATLTIKYLYAGYAAAALCGVAAALVDKPRRRRAWLALGAIVVGAQYFNTGRSNVVLAAVVLIVAECVARHRRPRCANSRPDRRCSSSLSWGSSPSVGRSSERRSTTRPWARLRVP